MTPTIYDQELPYSTIIRYDQCIIKRLSVRELHYHVSYEKSYSLSPSTEGKICTPERVQGREPIPTTLTRIQLHIHRPSPPLP
jgi:hypothetical protein